MGSIVRFTQSCVYVPKCKKCNGMDWADMKVIQYVVFPYNKLSWTYDF